MKLDHLKSLGFAILVLALSGCATKNASLRSSSASNTVVLDQDHEEIAMNEPILPEEVEAQESGEAPPTFDIPIVRNQKVETWLAYFQGRGRKWFDLWLTRSGKYVPFMRKILKDHGLPEDLVYLAMIESGFSSRAYSRARAVGPWQFMKSTGRLYGLHVDYWRDERRDPEKASVAAARHLKDLYDQFQSWKLAAAAYNAGAGKVSRAIKKYRTEDFWELTKGRFLKPETRNYVPKLIAAALIAKEPAKYGFDVVEYQDPLSYDKVILKEPVNLMILAEKMGMDLDELMALNPELNHPVTPPADAEYELRVPSGYSHKTLEAFNGMTSEERFETMAHTVRKGDTISKVASLYNVPSKTVAQMNGLSEKSRLSSGQTLVLPAPSITHLAGIRYREPERRRVSRNAVARNSVREPHIRYAATRGGNPGVERVHVVRRGETLWDIARRYGVSVGEIKEENELNRSRIIPGKRLVIPST